MGKNKTFKGKNPVYCIHGTHLRKMISNKNNYTFLKLLLMLKIIMPIHITFERFAQNIKAAEK